MWVMISLGGEGRGEGGLQTKIILPFIIFRQALSRNDAVGNDL